ncbi:response regulator [Bacteriovoracales bacterium]|nr:response regulator [Bacteriovoracales bacterium]
MNYPYFIYFSKDLEPNKEWEIFFSQKGYIFANCNSLDEIKNLFEKSPKNIVGILFNLHLENTVLQQAFSYLESTSHNPEVFALLNTQSVQEKKQAFEWGITDYFPPTIESEELLTRIEYLMSRERLQSDLLKDIKASLTLIDDSPNILDSLTSAFQDIGFKKVFSFLSGEEALKASEMTDIYVVDVVMGNKSGIEVISLLRQKAPEALIFCMSSVKNPDLAKKAIQNGANDFFSKPLYPLDIAYKIVKELENKK